MTLGEMRSLITSEGLRLTRSLGQNFLHDGNQIRRMVALAGVEAGDPVLEIGPGLGPLTEALLAQGARVRAIEKDLRLVPILQRRLGTHPGFELIAADAMDWLRPPPTLDPATRVVSNLPYSVGSALLVELASLPAPPRTITATLQAEVVQRVRAQPGTAEFGVLTLLLGRVYQATGSFRIPASCFFPAPNVESACVHLVRREQPLVADADVATFVQLVKRAFSQRRKRLRKTLREQWPEPRLDDAWQQLQLAEETRAETLSLETFAQLARLLGPAA